MTTAEVFGLSNPMAVLKPAHADAVDIGELVQTYSTVLFRVAHSILRNRTEAEDVVQEVFVRVLEHRARLPEVREMRVWLVRIAWNLALDRRRRLRPDQMDALFAASLVAPGKPADEVMAETRRLERVLLEIDRLPKVERQVLLLSSAEEFAVTEIAALIGRSESATRALLFRARQRLRERLQQGGKV